MTSPDPSSNEVLRLVALLRGIDQDLYKLSQCANFAEMRPIISRLCEGTFSRMQAESDRIRTLMIPQIREAYLNAAPQTPTTEPERPRLEGPRDASHPGIPNAGRNKEDIG